MPSVIAVIPARYGATRLPGKPLIDLGGQPMIQRVHARVRQTPAIERIIVATDDQRIAAAVAAFGGEARMTRADHASGTDRVAEVAATLDADIIVNVQGDEPLIAPETITAALRLLQTDSSAAIATTCEALDPAEAENPNVVKVVCDAAGYALYFSRSPIPYPRRPDAARSLWRKHTGLYAYRREALLRFTQLPPAPLELAEGLEQLRALTHGMRIRVAETAHPSPGVDTPEDAERIRRQLAGLSVAEPPDFEAWR
ncbi:MAG: 3-deoxy-manno-octulosonate cytidylyltransferase [Chloracidobacterium sp.]|uniref:3-deoxy-manno-octulosonate cytidylyltransferase n=1 Tax=Chloracidobacterium validum TaxID=2821543 RepID=A0ABX8BEZ3_9BACT|nr:3-deoxy-manno-octulosonate cytidylyltransferase [Chloracidobacterium validum]QUW04480.1 3-deoxy-manno-octulosonate cytidylyltransferase [Chloracidobacterium validum]